jgi:hypothetical protein
VDATNYEWMATYAGIYLPMDGFAKPLGWTPDCAEALRALAQVRFLKADANGNDLVIAPARMSRARSPGHRLDDQLDDFQPASRLPVIGVAHAHQAFAVALQKASWSRSGPGAG